MSGPDERFSQMVEEFSAAPKRGANEVLSPGFNERRTASGADPATASTEQSSALTPTEDPSRPGGEGGAPDYIIGATAASLLVLSIVLPAVTGGGWMWLLTIAIVVCTALAGAGLCAVVALPYQH